MRGQEFVSSFPAGIHLGATFDRNLIYNHTSLQQDYVTNRAELFELDLNGGVIWDIIIDYGDDLSGPDVIYEAYMQSFDSQLTA